MSVELAETHLRERELEAQLEVCHERIAKLEERREVDLRRIERLSLDWE